MKKKLDKEILFVYLSVLMAGILLIANLAATKLWDLFGIAVDGGLIVFPLSYVLGDVVVELYGAKRARNVIWAGLMLNILAVLVFVIVGRLPEYPGWGLQDSYEAILGFAPRIVAGSLLAFAASQLMNNLVFEKIKAKTGEKWLPVRTIGSSLLAHAVDSGIFETVAFLGVLPFGEFLAQAGFAYAAALGLEIALTPVTVVVIKGLKKWIR